MKKELTLQDIETGKTWYSTYGEEIVEYEYLCEYPSGNFHIIHDKKQDMPLIKDMGDDHLENTIRVLEKIESKTTYFEEMGAWDDPNY